MGEGNNLIIRDAQPADRVAIRAVTLASYAQYKQVMTPEYWKIYYEHLLETLDAEDARFIVAELDGAIVGSVRLVPPRAGDAANRQPGDNWPEVSILAVAPSTRGKGIARALLDECIRRAQRSGAPALGLHTEEAMSVALEMYRRRGFVRAPETDFYPRTDWHVMGFRLDLDDVEA
jgi:ribosomal protein S18 acetylase RimI-like enzyme